VEFVELFDEVFLGYLIESFLADLYFLERGEGFVEAVRFTESVIVCFFELLN
jgi:hypothetical protein